MKKETLLRKIYNTRGGPAYLASFPTLFRQAKKILPSIREKDVWDFLNKDPIYQQHSLKGRGKGKFPKVIAPYPGARLQCDLMFEKKRPFLVCIDSFSNWAFTESTGLKKTGKNVRNAMEKILKKRPKGFGALLGTSSDAGTEFSQLKNLLATQYNGAEHKILKTWQKSSMSENLIGKLRELYRKYKSKSGKSNFKQTLPFLLGTINKRYNRALGMSPREALMADPGKIFQRKYKTYIDNLKSVIDPELDAKFKINQNVRVSSYANAAKKATKFKSSATRFSTTIFKIESIRKNSLPFSYYLKDEDDQKINQPILEQFLIAA